MIKIVLKGVSPMSLNQLYSGGGKTRWIRKKEADRWHSLIAFHPKVRKMSELSPKIKIRVQIWFPDKRRRDHSNFVSMAIKFTEDALVKCGKMSDDSTKIMLDSGCGAIQPYEKGKHQTIIIIEEDIN